MLASHSSDSESSEPKQQPEMLSPLLKTSCMPVQQSEAGTDHAGRMLLFDKSSLRRTSWHPADFNCVLKSSLCRDLLDEKPYFCATALLLFLFMFFFFFQSISCVPCFKSSPKMQMFNHLLLLRGNWQERYSGYCLLLTPDFELMKS